MTGLIEGSDQAPASTGFDRRAFLQRLVLASAAAWGLASVPVGAAAGPLTRPVVDLYLQEPADRDIDLLDLTIAQAATRMREGSLTPVDLVERFLERIARFGATYQAWNTVLAERAIQRARRLRVGPDSPALTGIPIAVKDNFFTNGVLTTANSFIYRDFVPTFDATVVARLQRSGGIVLGKTQMGPLATTRATTPDGAITTVNAWTPQNPAVYPGGSSTGSATAVAGRMATVGIGTQTGGSITIPAQVQGLTGLKPTMGRCSLFGVIPLSYTRDHPGPLARDIKDAAIMLQSMAGPDPHDLRTLGLPEVPDLVKAATPVRRKGRVTIRWSTRLGVPTDYLTGDESVSALRRTMLNTMSNLGIDIVEIRLPDAWALLSGYAFNSVRLPERSEQFLEYLRSDLKLFGVSLTTWMQGLFVSGDEYVRGQRARLLLAEMALDQVFTACDVFAAERADAFDIVGFPLVAFPIGMAMDDDAATMLPVGGLLATRPYAEDRLCAVTAAYQAVTSHHRNRPPEPTQAGAHARSSTRRLRLSLEDVERTGA
ncbi:MAG: amidase [Actinomycetales bacterium]|nr:amidase [Actinomycetales bacterium]